MLNKAMNTMEQLRKAEELRISLINEAREALVILGAETQAENIQTITINKGRIVEVKTTEVKEVVIDNTDTDTIEMLRETIRRQNEIINDMNKQLEEAQNEYIIVNNDLAQMEITYELMGKDLSNKVDRINELELKLDEYKRNYAALKSENKEMEAELLKYDNQVSEPENKVEEEQELTIEILSDPKKRIKNLAEYKNNSLLKAIEILSDKEVQKQFPTLKIIPYLISLKKEAESRGLISKEQKDNEITGEEVKSTNYVKHFESKTNNKNKVSEIRGTYVNKESKEYSFIWTFGYEEPMIFGLLNEKEFNEAKEIIRKETNMTTETSHEGFIVNSNMININEENGIAIFNKGNGVFVGYTNKIYFKWDTNRYDAPVRTLLTNIFSTNPHHKRSMNNGKDGQITKEARFIIEYLIEKYETSNFGQKAQETYKDEFKKYKGYNIDTQEDEIDLDTFEF